MKPSLDILQTFYHRMMPLFTPQAERVLDTVPAQAFNEMAFRYTFSVDAMVKISRIIERQAQQTPLGADFHASFQYLSRLIPQQRPYREIARMTRGLWLYYAADADPMDLRDLLAMPKVRVIDTSDTPLVNYWFVIAYGEGVSMTLLAQEIPALLGDERYYEGFYTFQPDTAFQILSILHQIYPADVPVPQPPTPGFAV
ncbi:MAG: hypothetical protein R3E31_24750 [Chloroflexota bacterium]|nr:hypothetical protein [Anaerolineales bacterium]